MTAIIVGGSSGLGRALCEELAARGRDVVIVASDRADCERLATHLQLLHGVRAWPLALDAREPTAFAEAIADAAAPIGPVTDLFLPIGLASDADVVWPGGVPDQRGRDALWSVNYHAVVRTIERVQPGMATGGRIVGFGSIAATRGRDCNVQYAAAKSALSTWFEGLRVALLDASQTVQFYTIGYVESGQSFGRTQLFPALPARRAAVRVLHDGDRDFGRRFLPFWWRFVAVALRALPWRIFSRLGV